MFGLGPFETLEEFALNGLGLIGADEDESNEDESLGDEDSAGDEDESNEDESESSDEDDEDEDLTGLKESRDRALKQKATAKAKLAAAQARIAELEGKGKSEDSDADAAEDARIKQQESVIRDLQIERAFLLDNTHNWHDPKVALRLADLSEIEIDEDGTVDGLKQALADVAKKHPYLVNTEKKPVRKSGDPSRKQDDKTSKAARAAKLRSKYNI